MFRARTAQNVAISVGLQWFNRALAIVTKVVLVRLLLPADFGVFALATGLIGFVSTFGNFGLDYAIIQKGTAATDEDYDTGMSLRVLLSVGLFVASILAAGPWASLFGLPSVGPTSQVLAIGYLALPWSFVPSTRLTAELRYRAIAVPSMVGQFANAAIGIGLAFAHFGVWALVYSLLLSQIITTVAYSFMRSWRFRLALRGPVARPLLGYARYLVFAAVLGFLITNIDNFAVGKFLTPDELGFYTVAYAFGTIPGQLVSGPAGAALFPSLTKIVNDRELLRSGYLESFGYVMGITAPTSVGLAVVAPEVVSIVLGPIWSSVTLPLVILCFYGFARAPIDFSSSIFSAVGKPRVIAQLNLYILVLSLIPLFPMTIYWRIPGTALAMTVPVAIVSVLTIYRSADVVGARPRDFLLRSAGPLVAAEAMGVIVYAMRLGLYAVLPSRVVLPLGGVTVSEVTIVLVLVVAAGAILYFMLLRLVDRHLFDGLVRNGLLALGRGRRAP